MYLSAGHVIDEHKGNAAISVTTIIMSNRVNTSDIKMTQTPCVVFSLRETEGEY